MAVSLKHKFVSTKPDGLDSTLVNPTNWNDDHDLTMASGRMLGRVSAGTGAVEELTPEQARTLVDVPQAGVAGVNSRTASYTLLSSDRGKTIEVNVASSGTVTVPTNASVPFPIGTRIQIVQTGSGNVTIAGATGVTISAVSGGLVTSVQYGAITIYKRGTNEWIALPNEGVAGLDVVLAANAPSNLTLFDPLVVNGFHIVDPYGFAFVIIDDTFEIGAISAGSGSFDLLTADYQETANGSSYWAIQDEYGFDVARFDSKGLHTSKVITYTSDAIPTWTYENHIVIATGQSLSTGVNATPLLTTTQPYNSKMLSSGTKTYNSSPYTSATLVPLVEASTADGVESPLGGAAAFLNILIQRENNLSHTDHSFSVLGAATGLGSTPIGSHASGTTLYNRQVDVVSRMYTLSSSANNTAACLGLFWIQGESDVTTAQATYKADLIAYRSAFTSSVQAITGQTEPVKLFSYQTSSHLFYSQATPNSALAQLSAANEDAHIYLVTPIYHLDYSDGVHLTGVASRHLGAYMALAYKRVIIDGLDWKPLQPKSHIRQGNVCVITFDVPDGPLVLDTLSVTDPGNYGFALVNSAGSALTISSVSLAGPDRIKIVAASAIPSGAKVRYGWGNGATANSGPRTGARGCLRDSAGANLPSDFGLLHNWCVIFERSI